MYVLMDPEWILHVHSIRIQPVCQQASKFVLLWWLPSGFLQGSNGLSSHLAMLHWIGWWPAEADPATGRQDRLQDCSHIVRCVGTQHTVAMT